MLGWEGVVWAWPLEHFLEVVRSALRGLPTTPAVYDGHKRALGPLLFLLLGGTIGGAFADVLVSPRLAFEAVEDRFDRFFARGVAGGDVEEFLGGSQALAS